MGLSYTPSDPFDDKRRAEVLKAVRTSGLAAELRATTAFPRPEWEVTLRPALFDRDMNQSREYDIHATPGGQETRDERGKPIRSTFDLGIEVKASRREPWVVARPPTGVASPPQQYHPVATGTVTQAVSSRVATVQRQHGHPLFDPDEAKRPRKLWIDAAVVQPLQIAKDGRVWFDACTKACKAAEHLAGMRATEDIAAGRKEGPGVSEWRNLHVAQPVVVFDGMLLLLQYSDDGDHKLGKIPAAQIEFPFSTDKYTRGLYRVDIVTLSYLPTYATVMERVAGKLHEIAAAEN